MSVILSLDRVLSVVISACIAAAYTLLGGLYSVAYTDIAQLGLMLFGLVCTFILKLYCYMSIYKDLHSWLSI